MEKGRVIMMEMKNYKIGQQDWAIFGDEKDISQPLVSAVRRGGATEGKNF